MHPQLPADLRHGQPGITIPLADQRLKGVAEFPVRSVAPRHRQREDLIGFRPRAKLPAPGAGANLLHQVLKQLDRTDAGVPAAPRQLKPGDQLRQVRAVDGEPVILPDRCPAADVVKLSGEIKTDLARLENPACLPPAELSFPANAPEELEKLFPHTSVTPARSGHIVPGGTDMEQSVDRSCRIGAVNFRQFIKIAHPPVPPATFLLVIIHLSHCPFKTFTV